VNQLNAEIARVFTSPDMRDRLAREGTESVGGTAEQFAAFFKASMVKWARVISEANIKLE
jgi:tripartite-type tricarboxylate transporter receptor subunit TctC